MIRVTITVDDVRSTVTNHSPIGGPTIWEVQDLVEQAMMGVGFHPDNVTSLRKTAEEEDAPIRP